MFRDLLTNTYHITGAVDAVLKTTPGVLGVIRVNDVGTTATINIYDNQSGTDRLLFSWVSADGKLTANLNIRGINGLRVVVTNSPTAVFTWE